jgi:hypothetical protein
MFWEYVPPKPLKQARNLDEKIKVSMKAVLIANIFINGL